MLDLHVGDFDAPGFRLVVQNFLDVTVVLVQEEQDGQNILYIYIQDVLDIPWESEKPKLKHIRCHACGGLPGRP